MARVVWALALGVVILALAVLSACGGVFLLWYNSMPKDSQGFIVSETNKMPPVDSHAIVVVLVPLHMEEYMPSIVRGFETEKVVNIRLTATGTSSTGEIFVGVGKEEDVRSYMDQVGCAFADNYYWRVSPRNVTLRASEAVEHWGGEPSAPPTEKNFWLASGTGRPTATMEWVPQSGRHWIVIMNADGSAGLEVSIQLAARFPILGWIYIVFMLAGAILGVCGFLLIHYGLQRPHRASPP